MLSININLHKLRLFVDGGCKNNGPNADSATIGVFFGDKDPRNISAFIPPPPSNKELEMIHKKWPLVDWKEVKPPCRFTNNEAELHAILCAIKSVPDEKTKIAILSDSRYSI